MSSIFREAPAPDARRRTQAELLLERYGIVTREHVLAEGVPGGFSLLYDSFAALETLGVCRRGYFVEGLGGAQFALPGAVERLRAQKDSAEAAPLVLAATDPAQPYGAVLSWPRRDEERRRPQRVAGAYVVLAGSEPILYVERGGRGLLTLADVDDPRMRPRPGGPGRVRPRRPAAAAVARAHRRRARHRLAARAAARRGRRARRPAEAHAQRMTAGEEIRAAGGVVVRDGLVAVVHRPHHDDWSLPKGKLDDGESWEARRCARSSRSAAFSAPSASRSPTPPTSPTGRPKRVRWWLMTVIEDHGFEPSGEVDQLRWSTPSVAKALLTYADDQALLTHLP